MNKDLIALHTGDILTTHPASACEGEYCCIHNPSTHALDTAPLHWRADRDLMERICPHGVGHPDPDDIAHHNRNAGNDEDAGWRGVHGCDGCCRNQ